MYQENMPYDAVRVCKNIVFGFRMTRAKALIAGPHTYTFILLRNLVTDRPSQHAVLLAYLGGVVLMYLLHTGLVQYRNSVHPMAKSGAMTTLVHEYAATVTNWAHLAISTMHLLHVTAMREPFLVTFVLATLRLQQTLGGGKRSALFSGPMCMVVVSCLCITTMIAGPVEFELPLPPSRFAIEGHGPSAGVVVALCVAVGASAQAHLQWVVFHEHNDTLYMWNTPFAALLTFVSHIVLACASGAISAYHPVMIDVGMVVDNPGVGLLTPRLSLTIAVLLLCTAPINDSSVMRTILGDGAVITTTVFITQACPVVGSVGVVTVSVCVSILAFVFVYIRPDEWPSFHLYKRRPHIADEDL
jgi:hypothetical protein